MGVYYEYEASNVNFKVEDSSTGRTISWGIPNELVERAENGEEDAVNQLTNLKNFIDGIKEDSPEVYDELEERIKKYRPLLHAYLNKVG